MSPTGELIVAASISDDGIFLSIWSTDKFRDYFGLLEIYRIDDRKYTTDIAFRPDGRYFARLIAESGGEYEYRAIQIWGVCEP